MQDPSHRYVRNRLLSALSPEEYDAVSWVLEPVKLTTKDVLVVPNTPIGYVHFPETGIVSQVAVTDEGYRIEVGLIGHEGLTGSPMVLGVDRTPHESFVQVPGIPLRMSADTFLALVEELPSLRALLMRFLHVFHLQSAQTSLANGAYDIPERLARWLLMCSDRSENNEFQLTHEFMSMMLGVRRPGVTSATHILEGMGMIRAKRARITILDRDKLIDFAGDSYGVAEREYERLIGRR